MIDTRPEEDSETRGEFSEVVDVLSEEKRQEGRRAREWNRSRSRRLGLGKEESKEGRACLERRADREFYQLPLGEVVLEICWHAFLWLALLARPLIRG